MPGTSQASLVYSAQELPSPSTPVLEEAEAWKPPMDKKRKTAESTDPSYVFLRCEREARERERVKEDRAYELDKERLRQSDIERQERVRQRDIEAIELQLQASWLEFMKEGMRILERVLNERL
ncbi:hypothetical protein JYU34_010281 [Plutella xylostella]|uniref:Uncharacterized protein n=1 Tax=Plutella xylostella TaxID=51655 RepID=A0ABQ7QI70_PLUXY|nr:hypothetical protein JYU34_010281 [Plutella xylostella]